MQRPRFAPLFAFTEATHFFIFRLSHQQDRQHVSEFTTDELADFTPDRFAFGYYNRREHSFIQSVPLKRG
jgi:hypothetical protein